MAGHVIILRVLANVYPLLGVSAAIYLAFVLLLRRRILHFFEPAHIQIVFFSFAASCFWLYRDHLTYSWWMLFIPTAYFALCFALFYRRSIPYDPNVLAQRASLGARLEVRLLFLLCVTVIIAQAVAVGVSTGFKSAGGGIMSVRLEFLKTVPLLTYFQPPAVLLLPAFLVLYRANWRVWVALTAIAFSLLQQVWIASKGALLVPFFSLGAAWFVYRLDQICAGRRPTYFFTKWSYLGILATGALLAPLFLAAGAFLLGIGDVGAFFRLAATRLLLSYDHFHLVLAQDYLPVDENGFSIVKSYFSLILKSIGLRNIVEYNNGGEYVGEHLRGLNFAVNTGDRFLTLPNSNLILELLFSWPNWIGLCVFAVYVPAYMALLRWAERHRYTTATGFALFGMTVAGNPFLFFNGGSTFFFDLQTLFAMLGLSIGGAWVLKRLARTLPARARPSAV
jgi:hypothetical protein